MENCANRMACLPFEVLEDPAAVVCAAAQQQGHDTYRGASRCSEGICIVYKTRRSV
jgi:hypothetical protein